MWDGSDINFPDRVGNILYTQLENLAQVYRVNPYIIYVIYMRGYRGEGDTVASQSLLAISYIKALAPIIQRKMLENITEMTILVFIAAVQAAVQLRMTNAASMKAQWARAAPALHRTASTLAVWNGVTQRVIFGSGKEKEKTT